MKCLLLVHGDAWEQMGFRYGKNTEGTWKRLEKLGERKFGNGFWLNFGEVNKWRGGRLIWGRIWGEDGGEEKQGNFNWPPPNHQRHVALFYAFWIFTFLYILSPNIDFFRFLWDFLFFSFLRKENLWLI